MKKQKANIKVKEHLQPIPATVQDKFNRWYLPIALVLTVIAYIPALSAGFVNWDDQDYVTNNQMIRSFSDLGKFFTSIVQGNYHPLTMISLAINYAISGEDAWSYHLLNVLFHLCNVFLVYKFILKLSDQKYFVAFTCAVLFGIHPMHVESVAWVSERKDVLYSMFFLLGMISYLKYIDDNSRKQYLMTLLWFMLSLLSKPAAIIFPAVLFAMDYYRSRSWSFKLIAEKLPMLALSLILVYITMQQQKAAGATPLTEVYGWEKRIYFPFYTYMMYFYKMIWPFNLAAFYPLPPINESLSKTFTLAPFFFLATVIISIKKLKSYKEIPFGFAFYFLNLALVLQLFLFGSAIIADRYTYIPYIGMFFILGTLLYNSRLTLKTSFLIIMAVSLLFTFLSFKQSASWKDTGTLWDHAIKNFPSAKALTNRAYLYQQEGNFEKAIEYYNRSLKLNVIDKEVFYNLGLIYFNQNKDSLSLLHYNKALELKPDYVDALNGRGALYAKQGKNELALADFNKVHELNPEYELAYKNKAAAFFQEKKYDLAIEEYKKYLQLNKTDAEGFSNLCVSYLNKGANEEAIQACKQAILTDPKFAKAYTNIGAAYINLKQYPLALENLNTAFKLDSTNEENLKFLSLCYLNMGDTTKAMSIFEYANSIKR